MAAGIYQIGSIYRVNVLKKNGAAIAKTRLTKAKTAKFTSNIKEVSYEGDAAIDKIYYLTDFEVEIEADTWDAVLAAAAYGKTEVTSVTGVDSRYYFGDEAEGAGTTCGIEVLCLAKNLVDNSDCKIAIVAPVGVLSAATPPPAANLDKAGMTMKFSARRTDKDIAGTALVGVPTGGAMWYLDRLTP
jgi:hypothetical protein